MAGAPGKIAGDPVGQVPMGKGQRMGSGMGMDWPLAPWSRVRRLWLLMGPGAWPGRRCAGTRRGTAASAWGMAPASFAPGSVLGLGLRLNGQYQLDRFHQRDSNKGIGPCLRPRPRQ